MFKTHLNKAFGTDHDVNTGDIDRGIQLEDYDKKNHLGSDYTILDMEQRKNKARNSDQLFDRTPEASAPLCRINVSGEMAHI